MRVEDIAKKGWDGRLDVQFDCDLDRGIESCAPKTPYKVRQVTDSEINTLSKGYNIRWVSAHNVDASSSNCCFPSLRTNRH